MQLSPVALSLHDGRVLQVGQNGMTGLMMAASYGHAELCRLLMARGAKADRLSSRGVTALTYAIVYSEDTETVEVVGE